MNDESPGMSPRRRLKARTFGRLKAAATQSRQATQTLRTMRFPGYNGYGGSSIYGRRLSGSDYDYAGRAGDLADNSAVAACLRVLCDNFPQPLLQVEGKDEQGQWKAIDGHPLPALFDRPNPFYDHYDLWSAVIMSLVVDGNGYLLKIRSAAGIPVELWWVPPWMIRPYWADDVTFITWYEYYSSGEWLPLAPTEVIHFRMGRPDPVSVGRTHLSWLKSGLRSVCALNEVDGYTASLLRNGGVPSVIISPAAPSSSSAVSSGRFTKDDADELKSNYRQRVTGENRGDPLVLTGPYNIVPLGFSPEQLALDKIPARLEDQICSLTGVNAMIALLTSGAQHKTYNNIQESRRGLYEDLITPCQTRAAKKLDLQLLGDVGIGDPATQRVAWDYEGIPCLQEDQNIIWDRAGKAYSTYKMITRAKSLEMVGLDYRPEDQVYFDEAVAAVAQQTAEVQADLAADASVEPTDEPADPDKAPVDRELTEDSVDEKSAHERIAGQIDALARSAPVPVDESEAMVVAKAVATLEMIQAGLWAADGPRKRRQKVEAAGLGVTYKASATDRSEDPGVMVAFFVPKDVAESLAVAGGEPVEQLHVTLAYLGRVSEVGEDRLDSLREVLSSVAGLSSPLEGKLGGTGRFPASESSDGSDVIYACVDVPGLIELRQEIVAKIEDGGFTYKKNHGYTPHVTIAYVDPETPTGETFALRPVRFNSLSLAVGDQIDHWSLAGSVVDAT